jgi:hypothetical protein
MLHPNPAPSFLNQQKYSWKAYDALYSSDQLRACKRSAWCASGLKSKLVCVSLRFDKNPSCSFGENFAKMCFRGPAAGPSRPVGRRVTNHKNTPPPTDAKVRLHGWSSPRLPQAAGHYWRRTHPLRNREYGVSSSSGHDLSAVAYSAGCCTPLQSGLLRGSVHYSTLLQLPPLVACHHSGGMMPRTQ